MTKEVKTQIFSLFHIDFALIIFINIIYFQNLALTPLVVNRIFSKAVVRGSRTEHIVEFIGLAEFAAFLMADEDKKNMTRYSLR